MRLSETCANPFSRLNEWLKAAEEKGIVDHNAMALATTGKDNSPNVRMVLLRGLNEECLLFYTNYQSTKARELNENAQASVLFFWRELGRQIRIFGSVERTSRSQSEAYFASRPRGSQISAIASEQSQPLSSRADLEKKVEQLEREFEGKEIECPQDWGGFKLKPERFEFWENGDYRLHHRLLYTPSGDGSWQHCLLQP